MGVRPVLRYKIYKDGKFWVYANITALSLGLSMAITPTNAQAATVTVATPSAITATETNQAVATDHSGSLSFGTPETTTTTNNDIDDATTKSVADDNADREQTPPTAAEDANTTPTKAEDLNNTYTDAKDQTDNANKAATDANKSLAVLQALLADEKLTQTDGWQAKLQAALDDFKAKADAFTGSVTDTDATVAAYQKAIDALIVSKPNAVDKVTQGEDGKGNTIADYDNLVKAYKEQVEQQLAGLQNNLDNYDNATGVNAAQTALKTAAVALNDAIDKSNTTTTVTNLTELKAAYDEALAAYNAAVDTYNENENATTKIPTVQTNADGETDDGKNPSDQAFEDVKNYLNAKEAYTAAKNAYDNTAGKADQVTKHLTAWQTAVTQYNEALKTLQDIDLSGITAADTAKIKEAKAVQDASVATIKAQKAYDAATSADEKDADELASTAKELSTKLATLQATVDAWNKTYTAYLAAVKEKAAEDIAIPDLGTLGQSVTTAQTALSGSTVALQTSQTTYKNALDAYQAALDAYNTGQNAARGDLPDLTAFNDSLQTQFTANNQTMAGANALVAVKNAERALQQKVNEINGYVTGINNTQAVWQVTADAGAETGAWNLLTTQLAAIGSQLSTTGAAYQTAGKSYETLVNNYLASITAYNNAVTEKDRLVASTYTDVNTVTSSISAFKESLDTFQNAYDELMNTIATNAPDLDANEKAQTSLSNGTQLSTDGTVSKTSDRGVRFFPQGIYMIGGSSLESIASQPFDEKDLAEGLVNLNIGQETFDANDLGIINKADLIKTEDEQGNAIYKLKEADKARWMGVFRRKLLSTYVDNGKTYHLAAYFVPGTNADNTNPARPGGYYTFTTLDPITEFFNNFLGSSPNIGNNPYFYFYYVAEPDNITKTETDEAGQTSTVSAITMPTAASIDNLTAVNTNLALTANGTLASEPTVSEMTDDSATLKYRGGDTVETTLGELSIESASTITLNHAEVPTDPTDPSKPDGSTDSTDPTDPADPGNPSRPVNPDNGSNHDYSGDDHGNPNDDDAEEPGGLDKDENIALPQTGASKTVKQQVISALPQTGDRQTQQRRLQVIGTALLSLVVLVGGLTIRKRRDQRN